MAFKFKKTEQGINLELAPGTLTIDATEVSLVAGFPSGKATVNRIFTPELLTILGLQCPAKQPESKPEIRIAGIAQAYRQQARALHPLSGLNR